MILLLSSILTTNYLITGPSSKRRQLAPTGLLNAKSQELYGISGLPKSGMVMNGKPKVATITRIAGRKQMISWVDAPDDVFFIATEATRYDIEVCSRDDQ